MLEVKTTITEMRHAFDGLVSRQDMAEGGISELKDVSTEPSKTEKQKGQRLSKQPNQPGLHTQGLWDNRAKGLCRYD